MVLNELGRWQKTLGQFDLLSMNWNQNFPDKCVLWSKQLCRQYDSEFVRQRNQASIKGFVMKRGEAKSVTRIEPRVLVVTPWHDMARYKKSRI